jgi:hypothetical protein
MTVSLIDNNSGNTIEQNENNINLIDELHSLESQRLDLEQTITRNQFEIDKAKAAQKDTGVYADPNWFATTKAAIRENTVSLHNINRNIKDIRRQISRTNPKSSYFQKAAKNMLDSNTYEQIVNLAEQYILQTN